MRIIRLWERKSDIWMIGNWFERLSALDAAKAIGIRNSWEPAENLQGFLWI